MIYVDHFIDFYNTWYECLFLKTPESKTPIILLKGMFFSPC